MTEPIPPATSPHTPVTKRRWLARRGVIALLALPLLAVTAVGAVLLATHHTAIPKLSPSPSGSGGTGTAAAVTCERPRVREPFVGIAINPAIGPHVLTFEHATGAHIGIVEFYNPFDKPFQRWEAAQAVKAGALPLVQLNPRHESLARIAAGTFDAQIRRYAAAVRDFHCEIVLSFGHEMNGWWYSWGLPWTKPATYIAAWRHIHDVFAAQHVTNVIWAWDPTHQYHGSAHGKKASFASRWYPGNRYVDWIGIDGYLGRGQTFAGIFGPQLKDIREVAKGKQIFLGETGVAGGPSQGWQIADLFGALTKYHLTGLVWFDLNRKQPWRIEARPAALVAFRKAIAKLPPVG